MFDYPMEKSKIQPLIYQYTNLLNKKEAAAFGGLEIPDYLLDLQQNDS